MDEILLTKVEQVQQMYNTTIGIELFFFLVKSMHPDLLSLALDVRAQHGPFGSQLYRVLEARFGTMDGQGLDSDIDHQYSLLSSSKSEESATTVAATVNGQSKSRKFTSVQSGIDIRDYPILRQNTWPAWHEKLLHELSTNWTALGILNGSIEEGHPSYDSGIDEDLYCLIRFTALESYEKIVDDTEAQHGRKGRKL